MLDKIKKAIAHSRFAPIFIPDNRCGRIITNINLDLTRKQKKVLLIYLDMVDAGYQVSKNSYKGNSGSIHTNRFELFQMIKCMIDMDFCIDVCAYDDVQAQKYIEKMEYDVIIGLGEMFRWATQYKNAFKIMYMTENPYYVSYKRECERVKYFEQRHQKKIDLQRTGMFFKENDEKMADAIICLGDSTYYNSLNIPVERIYPSAFYNEEFDLKKVNRRKNCFLVFGTDGFIHKGIDLLVEVFIEHQEWELYLCGYQVTETVKKLLGIDISGTNIHDCGYIRADSQAFLNLASTCQFVLLPSCSEATSTAVLTGMRHGLIPGVMHGNGFDEMGDYCTFFEGYDLEDIENKISELVMLEASEIKKREKSVYEFANKKFTLQNFSMSYKEAVKNIIQTFDI